MKIKFLVIQNGTQLAEFLERGSIGGDQPVLPVYGDIKDRIQSKYTDERLYCFQPYEQLQGRETAEADAVTAEQLADRHNLALGRSGDYVCFLEGTHPECAAELLQALLIAKYLQRKFFAYSENHELEGLISSESPRSLLVILPYHKLDISGHFRLIRKYDGVSMGYLTYINKLSINFYAVKRMMFQWTYGQAEQKSMVINRVNDEGEAGKIQEGDEEVHYFTRGQCSLDRLGPFFKRESRLLEFNYISHCRECALRFGDFLLCGINKRDKALVPPEPDRKHIPCCDYDEEACYLDKAGRINASELNADLLFLNGCSLGDLNRSIIPYGFTVVSNLLENNAISIVTSAGIKTAHTSESILAHHLSQSGFSEGEKVNYLNRFLSYNRIESPNYFLLGDPILGRGKGNHGQTTGLRIRQVDSEDSMNVFIEGVSGRNFLEVGVETGRFNGRGFVADIVPVGPTEAGRDNLEEDIYFFWKQGEEGKPDKLVLFSQKQFQKNEILVRISGRDETQEGINRLVEQNECLKFYREYFTLSSALRGKMTDAQNQFKPMVPLYREHAFSLSSLRKAKRMIEKQEKRLGGIFEEIFRSVVDYSVKSMDNFFESMAEARTSVDSVDCGSFCPRCGNPSVRCTYRIFSFDRSFYRYSCKCPDCGMNRDVADEQLELWTPGDIKIKQGSGSYNVLQVTNRHARPVKLYAAAVSIDTREIGIRPGTVEATVAPGERFSLDLILKPSGTIKKHYYLFSYYVMADGKLYFISDTVSCV